MFRSLWIVFLAFNGLSLYSSPGMEARAREANRLIQEAETKKHLQSLMIFTLAEKNEYDRLYANQEWACEFDFSKKEYIYKLLSKFGAGSASTLMTSVGVTQNPMQPAFPRSAFDDQPAEEQKIFDFFGQPVGSAIPLPAYTLDQSIFGPQPVGDTYSTETIPWQTPSYPKFIPAYFDFDYKQHATKMVEDSQAKLALGRAGISGKLSIVKPQFSKFDPLAKSNPTIEVSHEFKNVWLSLQQEQKFGSTLNCVWPACQNGLEKFINFYQPLLGRSEASRVTEFCNYFNRLNVSSLDEAYLYYICCYIHMFYMMTDASLETSVELCKRDCFVYNRFEQLTDILSSQACSGYYQYLCAQIGHVSFLRFALSYILSLQERPELTKSNYFLRIVYTILLKAFGQMPEHDWNGDFRILEPILNQWVLRHDDRQVGETSLSQSASQMSQHSELGNRYTSAASAFCRNIDLQTKDVQPSQTNSVQETNVPGGSSLWGPVPGLAAEPNQLHVCNDTTTLESAYYTVSAASAPNKAVFSFVDSLRIDLQTYNPISRESQHVGRGALEGIWPATTTANNLYNWVFSVGISSCWNSVEKSLKIFIDEYEDQMLKVNLMDDDRRIQFLREYFQHPCRALENDENALLYICCYTHVFFMFSKQNFSYSVSGDYQDLVQGVFAQHNYHTTNIHDSYGIRNTYDHIYGCMPGGERIARLTYFRFLIFYILYLKYCTGNNAIGSDVLKAVYTILYTGLRRQVEQYEERFDLSINMYNLNKIMVELRGASGH